MSKLNGKTLDIEEQNIERLKELFPEIDTDGKIDFEKLKQILGDYVDDSDERYKFTWNGKGEALRLSQTPSMGTLRPAPEEGESKDWDNTENLYIEGDNLEVLKLLQKSYFGKIKMIYIDPPYNTGKDFVYKDNYKDNIKNYKKITGQVDDEGKATTTNPEYSGRYHTDWLNMMYPRLRLARNLLTDDGVVFISIDDNEVHNLRKICDEIFGEDNILGENHVIIKTEGRRYGFFAKTNETFLVYAKNIQKTKLNEISIEGKKFRYKDEYGGFNLQDLRNQNARAFNSTNRPNLRYPFYADESQIKNNEFLDIYLSQNSKDSLTEVWAITTNDYKSVWRWGKDKSKKEILKNLTGRKGHDGVIRIFQKMRNIKELPKSIWVGREFLSNKGTKEAAEILGDGIFDFPKTLGFASQVLEIGSSEDDVILDFFSGSSTTAHAAMMLNAEDNGNRKYIMVQLQEPTDVKSEAYKAGYKNISEIGKERIRRAGDKIKLELEEKWKNATEEERKDMKNPDQLDTGFKVFKLDSSNIKEWNPGKYENIQLAIEDSSNPYVEGRTEEDAVYEMVLKMGLELTHPIEKVGINDKIVYSIGYGLLMICLSRDIDLSVAKKMIEIKDENNQIEFRVIFRDEGFNSDTDKTNVKETLKAAGLAEEAFITL